MIRMAVAPPPTVLSPLMYRQLVAQQRMAIPRYHIQSAMLAAVPQAPTPVVHVVQQPPQQYSQQSQQQHSLQSHSQYSQQQPPQQQQHPQYTGDVPATLALPTALMPSSDASSPDEDALNDFKNDVRMWLELDGTIRRLQTALKERRAARTALHDRITRFMNEFNIEDLNTREGRLRYHVTYVRTPLSQQVIRDRINSFFQNNANIAQALQGAVFGVRERKEHRALRRLTSR